MTLTYQGKLFFHHLAWLLKSYLNYEILILDET